LNSVNYGGLDVALRVDNTSLCVLKLEDNQLEQIGQKIWPHIPFDKINNDLLKIQNKERMAAIGYDRLGVGDGARYLFSKALPLRDIVSSQPNKLDMISLVKGLFDQERLLVHDPELYKEILEQERKVSDAGNVLYQHPSGFHDDRFWSLCYACSVAAYAMSGVPRPRIAVQKSRRQTDLNILADKAIEKGLNTI
jgi:hypothetical protein